MTLYQWSNDLSIGIPQIDREHRRLIDLAGAMREAMLKGVGRTMLDSLLEDVLLYAWEHFAHEEELMRGAGYPDIQRHTNEHDEFRERVLALQRRAADGEVTMTIEVLQFLLDWIRAHIALSDREIGVYLADPRHSGQDGATPCGTA